MVAAVDITESLLFGGGDVGGGDLGFDDADVATAKAAAAVDVLLLDRYNGNEVACKVIVFNKIAIVTSICNIFIMYAYLFKAV